MFTKQYLKKKRCNECRRRKKKCQMCGDSCLYCTQKGIKCTLSDEVLNFDPQNGKVNKKQFIHNNLISLNNKDEYKILLLKPNIPIQFSFPNQNKFFLTGYLGRKLFVPFSHSLNKSNTLSIRNDTKFTIHVYNKDMVIDANFALSKFALSSVRIKYIYYKPNLETDRINIERTANPVKDGPFGFFQKNNVIILQNQNEKIDSTNATVKSIDDINLKVDFKNLKNILKIEEPAIRTDSKNKKFINLPYFISSKTANSLFDYFYEICTKEFPNPQISLSSSPSNSKISVLTVALPLILGNLMILRTVLLCSYFHKLQNVGKDKTLTKILPQMKRLHLEVLAELDRRLEYYSSVSCDHSLFCVFVLLTIEIINGGKGTLWNGFQSLAQTMIALRGGVTELSQTLTGECILKLLVGLLCTEIDHDCLAFDIDDIKYLFQFNEKHEFFDNLVNMNSIISKDFKGVIQIYFQASVLRSLVDPCLGLDNKENGINYETISESNLEKIMYEAFVLEMDIKCFDFIDIANGSLVSQQIKFAVEACILYIYQSVYKQPSLSPNTLLLIKSLKHDVDNILSKLKNLTELEFYQTPVLILPIFCYGVDLVGHDNRKRFINDLSYIYKISHKEMIKSAMDLLNIIWDQNRDGSGFVDWRTLSKRKFINICLYC